jgi:hypothetical protein
MVTPALRRVELADLYDQLRKRGDIPLFLHFASYLPDLRPYLATTIFLNYASYGLRS